MGNPTDDANELASPGKITRPSWSVLLATRTMCVSASLEDDPNVFFFAAAICWMNKGRASNDSRDVTEKTSRYPRAALSACSRNEPYSSFPAVSTMSNVQGSSSIFLFVMKTSSIVSSYLSSNAPVVNIFAIVVLPTIAGPTIATLYVSVIPLFLFLFLLDLLSFFFFFFLLLVERKGQRRQQHEEGGEEGKEETRTVVGVVF